MKVFGYCRLKGYDMESSQNCVDKIGTWTFRSKRVPEGRIAEVEKDRHGFHYVDSFQKLYFDDEENLEAWMLETPQGKLFSTNLQRMKSEEREYYGKHDIPSVNPEDVKPGDRLVYGCNNRWTALRKFSIDCSCGDHEDFWVVRERSEFQLWDWGSKDFWENVVLVKYQKERAELMSKKHEKDMEVFREETRVKRLIDAEKVFALPVDPYSTESVGLEYRGS